GCVDFVLPPPAIARELAQISRHPYVNHRPEAKRGEMVAGRDDELAAVFRLLLASTGVDFSHYKPNTIQRRIHRRMALLKLHRLGDYVKHLRQHPAEGKQLYEDLLINVTGFFRDADAFQALRKK